MTHPQDLPMSNGQRCVVTAWVWGDDLQHGTMDHDRPWKTTAWGEGGTQQATGCRNHINGDTD